MILSSMTPEEIQDNVFKILPEMYKKSVKLYTKYRKEFIRKPRTNCPTYFTKVEKIKVQNNEIALVFGSTTGSVKDFGNFAYIVLNTDFGKEYIQILTSGHIRIFTKHFIDRFVERSPYNCNKSNFLPYLCKELAEFVLIEDIESTYYIHTLNGLAVCNKETAITYMTDLSEYKTNLRNNSKTISKEYGYTRREAMEACRNSLIIHKVNDGS